MSEPPPTAVLPDQRPTSQAAERLRRAATSGTPCAPVRDLIGSADVAAAYAVQEAMTRERLATGARIVGRKIGLTSEAVQRQLGVDRPDFGVLFDDMSCGEDDEVPYQSLLQPKIEAEIAFILGADLVDGPLDEVQVREAVTSAVAALEIVDSRIAGWDITFGDTVADNASSGLFVLGRNHLALESFEPKEAEMTMSRSAESGPPETVSSGSGRACLGDPLAALAWLARTARDLGQPLLAGQVILSGALGPMVTVEPGDVFTASVTGLGQVTARFSNRTKGLHDE